MASLGALSALDLSDSTVGAGVHLHAYSGDVPDYFYSLFLPEDMLGMFWLAELDGAEFKLFVLDAVAAGHPPEMFSGTDCLAFAVPPMGFAWAPVLAQLCLEEVVEGVEGLNCQNRVVHRRVAPIVGGDKEGRPPPHWQYIDDWGVLAAGMSVPEALEHAQAAGGAVKSALEARGLKSHKEQVGARVEVLGAVFELDKRKLLPKPKPFVELYEATRWLVDKAGQVGLVHSAT
jgi:hypothetical protein